MQQGIIIYGEELFIVRPPKTYCECLQGCSSNEHRPLTRLIAKREELGITQKAMARRFGIGQSFYAKLERGEKLCPERILNKLQIYGVLQYRGT